MKRTLFAAAALVCAAAALAQEPTPIRFGRGFAAEEQVWLMSARPDLAPNQGKKYQLKQILFQANPERFQAYLAGELDAGTAPGLAVIFARAQGVDMKIVASICLEAAGSQWFSTTYMERRRSDQERQGSEGRHGRRRRLQDRHRPLGARRPAERRPRARQGREGVLARLPGDG